MLQDLGKTKEVNILDSLDSVINPATNEKLDELKSILENIDANTDDLELKADTVNVNIDEVESLISEVKNALGQESGNNILTELSNILESLTPSTGNPAKHVKLTDEREGAGQGHFANISPDNRLFVQLFGSLMMGENWLDGVEERWQETISGSASKTVNNSILQLSVTTNSNDSIQEYFKQIIEHEESGAFVKYITAIKFEDEQTDNVKEWGVIDSSYNNGYFYRLDGSKFYLVLLKNGVENLIDITSSKPIDGQYHIYNLEFLDNYILYAHIDGTLVTLQTASSDVLIGTKQFIPIFKHYNNNTLTDAPGTLYIDGVALLDLSSYKFGITGKTDKGFIKDVAVTQSGRLLVSQETPSAPDETTAVKITEYGDVATEDENEYIIPTGETLTIQRLSASAEVDTTGGSVVELWYDSGETGSVREIIDAIFTSANADQHGLNENFTGDGNAKIILTRRRLSGGAKEIFARWEGYY